MAAADVPPKGVLTPDATDTRTPEEAPGTPGTSDALDKNAIERLGRQRPAILSSVLMESAFVATVVCSMMMSEYFIGGFFLCLPLIADALHIPTSEQTWPAGVINLTTAAFLLPAARLCDRYGGRIVFLVGHVWLLIWSIACGFTQNSIALIICRAMQGVGASAFMPAGLALLGQTYRPGPRKNLVFALYGAFACMGFYIGMLMGAIAAEFLNWRWYFWIGAIMVGAVVVSGFLTIPRELGISDKSVKMDWLGVVTIVPGLILVVFAFTDGGHAPDGWATPYIYVTLIIGVLLLGAAVYVEGWVATSPLLPPDLFKPKGMKRLTFGLFGFYGVFGVFLFFANMYVERVMHTTPLQTAAWFTPLAVGGMMLAICGGFVLHILSGRMLMTISGLGFLLSALLFAVFPEQTDDNPSTSFLYWAYVFPAMVCSTIGVDITFNVSNVFITTAMPRRLQAAASALINSILYLGIAFWLGVGEMAVALTAESRGEGNMTMREQYQVGFWVGVGLAALSLCLIVTVRLGRASAELTVDERAELEEASRAAER